MNAYMNILKNVDVSMVLGMVAGIVLAMGSLAGLFYLEISFLRLFTEVSFTEGFLWVTVAFAMCYTTKIFYKNNSIEESVIQGLIYTGVLVFAFGVAGLYLSILVNTIGVVFYIATSIYCIKKEYAFPRLEKPEYRFW